ncbi:hypothetical protein J3A78_003495 [Streptomyces sp. PvR006]|nr:hypothetical protein [Streptomyces sp. PvR006]
MRRHIHALIRVAADLVYCGTCGWWHPPHSH